MRKRMENGNRRGPVADIGRSFFSPRKNHRRYEMLRHIPFVMRHPREMKLGRMWRSDKKADARGDDG
jgi:hypothetical protein